MAVLPPSSHLKIPLRLRQIRDSRHNNSSSHPNRRRSRHRHTLLHPPHSPPPRNRRLTPTGSRTGPSAERHADRRSRRDFRTRSRALARPSERRGPRDPGRLLREEKMRKRVSREKPRVSFSSFHIKTYIYLTYLFST